METSHGTAFISLETWQYSSPFLKALGKASDLGLLAKALVYYDDVVIEIQSPQQIDDIVSWAVQTGSLKDLLRLIGNGHLRFHNHAFVTAAVNIDGIFSLWNIQEKDHSVARFNQRVIQSAVLSGIPARHRSSLFRAIREHSSIAVADDYAAAIEDARRALHSQATCNALLQAAVDEIYAKKQLGRPPAVQCQITYQPEQWTVVWNPDLAWLTEQSGRNVEYRSDTPITGEAIANRLIWTAFTNGYDLVLGDVMTAVVARKLVESGSRAGKVPEVLRQLEVEVDFPDIRTLVNRDEHGFAKVMQVRRHSQRFRQWLQERGEKDASSVSAYHHEIASASGIRRAGGTTLQVLGLEQRP